MVKNGVCSGHCSQGQIISLEGKSHTPLVVGIYRLVCIGMD